MINYDLNKIKAIIFDVDGVLSSSTVLIGNDGEPLRTSNIKDGYAIQLAVKKGLRIAIITGARTESIKARYEYLGVEDIHIGSSMKIHYYNRFKEKYNLMDEEIIYVGDDIPDYEIMKKVGCACCPSDACEDILGISKYVSRKSGGNGCARDIIEQVLKFQGKWMSENAAFGW